MKWLLLVGLINVDHNLAGPGMVTWQIRQTPPESQASLATCIEAANIVGEINMACLGPDGQRIELAPTRNNHFLPKQCVQHMPWNPPPQGCRELSQMTGADIQ